MNKTKQTNQTAIIVSIITAIAVVVAALVNRAGNDTPSEPEDRKVVAPAAETLNYQENKDNTGTAIQTVNGDVNITQQGK